MSLLADDNARGLDIQVEVRLYGLMGAMRLDGSLAVSVKPCSTACGERPFTLVDGISNLHHENQLKPSTLGTVGFYALVNGCRRRELVLVSNRHVLLSSGGSQGDPIYRCDDARRETAEVIRDHDPIAQVLDKGSEENYRYAYPGEDAADYFIDCATARVLHPESRPRNETCVRRAARIHPLDVAGSRSCRVRKAGRATGLTEGRVVDAAATVQSGGISRARNLAIRGIGQRFAEPGDSGALIVNDRDEAVGLLWGRNDGDPDISYGCHIHPVLDRLGVTMLTRGMQ